MDPKEYPDLARPKWKWQWPIWYVVIPAVFGVVPFLAPDYNKLSSTELYAIAGFLFSLAVFAPAVVLLLRTIFVVCLRIRYYSKLHKKAVENYNQVRILSKHIAILTPNQARFEIKSVSIKPNTNVIYIYVYTNKIIKLVKDDILVVIDASDNTVMGEFVVTQVRPDDYHAENVAHSIDPLWLADIMKMDKSQFDPPANTFAFFTGKSNEQ